MATVLHPWQILVTAMAGWITRQQDALKTLVPEPRLELGRPCGQMG
jgi:hypothetical protein